MTKTPNKIFWVLIFLMGARLGFAGSPSANRFALVNSYSLAIFSCGCSLGGGLGGLERFAPLTDDLVKKKGSIKMMFAGDTFAVVDNFPPESSVIEFQNITLKLINSFKDSIYAPSAWDLTKLAPADLQRIKKASKFKWVASNISPKVDKMWEESLPVTVGSESLTLYSLVSDAVGDVKARYTVIPPEKYLREVVLPQAQKSKRPIMVILTNDMEPLPALKEISKEAGLLVFEAHGNSNEGIRYREDRTLQIGARTKGRQITELELDALPKPFVSFRPPALELVKGSVYSVDKSLERPSAFTKILKKLKKEFVQIE